LRGNANGRHHLLKERVPHPISFDSDDFAQEIERWRRHKTSPLHLLIDY
jgi:hypothetical protein